MSQLMTLVFMLCLAFAVVDQVLGLLLDLVRRPAEDLLQTVLSRIQKRARPPGSKPVLFICEDRKARYAEEVYVAGTFNDWLRSERGQIRPYTWQRKVYRLEKHIEDEQVIWKGEIWLQPGYHEFKFVVGRNTWIHWHEDSGYACGSSASGGPNFELFVEL